MKFLKAEKWEQNYINSLTLKCILAATIGTAAASAIAYSLQRIRAFEIRPELLFIPWGIALVVGISIAFRQGVLAERRRTAKESKDKN